MEQNIAISVKELEKSYGKRKVLHGISFHVGANRVVGFLGPNGAGKTTTIKLILGFLNPDVGSVEIMGFKTERNKNIANIGYVPEAPQLYPYLTGRELLALTGRLIGMKTNVLEKEIENICEFFAITDCIENKMSTYSFGDTKKVAYAQAMLGDPDILIFDEPYNGLDPIGINKVREMILELKRKGKTVFLSSHFLSEMEKICDDVIMINQGKIILTGEIHKLKQCFKIVNFAKSNERFKQILENHKIKTEELKASFFSEIRDNELEKIIKLLKEKHEFSDFLNELPSLENIFLNLLQ